MVRLTSVLAIKTHYNESGLSLLWYISNKDVRKGGKDQEKKVLWSSPLFYFLMFWKIKWLYIGFGGLFLTQAHMV